MQRLVTTHVGVTNRGLNDIKLEIANQKQSLTGLGEAFTDWVTKTAKQVNERLNKADIATTELGKTVQKQANLITQDVIPRIVILESQGPGSEWVGFTPKQVTAEAMQCIRVLSQAQDVVTDKEFVLKTNNETLTKKLQNSTPYKECVEKITDERLKADFISAFAPFDKGDHDERGDRLIMIQRLNIKLLRFFAPRIP